MAVRRHAAAATRQLQARRRPRREGATTSTAGRCRGRRRRPELVAERLDALRRDVRGQGDRRARGRAVELVRAPLAAGASGTARRTAFATLRTCLLTVAKMLAPFCPFVADEIYDNLDGELASVHLCDFPAARRSRACATWSSSRRWRSRARRCASGWAPAAQAKIKVRQPLGEAVVVADGRERDGDRTAGGGGARGAERARACASWRRRTSWAATRSRPTTARSARCSAARCRWRRRRSRRSTRRMSRRRCATAARSGSRWAAASTRSRPTTCC